MTLRPILGHVSYKRSTSRNTYYVRCDRMAGHLIPSFLTEFSSWYYLYLWSLPSPYFALLALHSRFSLNDASLVTYIEATWLFQRIFRNKIITLWDMHKSTFFIAFLDWTGGTWLFHNLKVHLTPIFDEELMAIWNSCFEPTPDHTPDKIRR